VITALRLCRDSRGVSAVEFALLAPLLLMLLGLFDLSHHMYTDSILQGAIQKAARDSTIEGAPVNEAAIDDRVEAAVRGIAPNAAVTFTRTAYSEFSAVGRGEDFTDTIASPDGICNDGEPFEDANGNGIWDSDRGVADSFGSGRDAVLYTVSATYNRLFAINAFLGGPNTITTEVSVVLRNQPYGMQNTPTVGSCT
jgi:TadE-like protein